MTGLSRILLSFVAAVALAQQSQSPFSSVPPAESDALQFGKTFPEFEAKDISGRVWRNEDLRGKYTVIYIWHTFEARRVATGFRCSPSAGTTTTCMRTTT